MSTILQCVATLIQSVIITLGHLTRLMNAVRQTGQSPFGFSMNVGLGELGLILTYFTS